MRFRVIAVGRPRAAALRDVIDDFVARAERYWPLDVVEVREESARALDPLQVRQREGARLRERLAPGGMVVACDASGRSHTSEQFATWMRHRQEAARDVSLVIGGAFGLDPALRDAADERLALAPWTLPHDLARLVLVEQLYRAGTIVRGEPYHK
ncbi:MAG: 23S rRNA (pseudouridine(1915)-N(3))-methyltransferase RlmH [Gemmatimonadaceae bacterium]|nr:23S rRNA (pseudouridine(1915)-N(3))-methyltransferase RlmH [Gemmatimonadaceae bacterium]